MGDRHGELGVDQGPGRARLGGEDERVEGPLLGAEERPRRIDDRELRVGQVVVDLVGVVAPVRDRQVEGRQRPDGGTAAELAAAVVADDEGEGLLEHGTGEAHPLEALGRDREAGHHHVEHAGVEKLREAPGSVRKNSTRTPGRGPARGPSRRRSRRARPPRCERRRAGGRARSRRAGCRGTAPRSSVSRGAPASASGDSSRSRQGPSAAGRVAG